MVADAVEAHHVLDAGHRGRERGAYVLREVLVARAVADGQAPGEHAGARSPGVLQRNSAAGSVFSFAIGRIMT